MTRDPRIDPQPGDIVQATSGKGRHVIGVARGDIRYRQIDCKNQAERMCWLSTWREWCRKNKAEVVIRVVATKKEDPNGTPQPPH